MRVFYFTLCILAGLSAGLLWSFSSNRFPIDPGSIKNAVLGNVTNVATTASESVNHTAPNDPYDSTAQSVSVSNSSNQRPYSYYDGIMRVAPSVVSVYAGSSNGENRNGFSSQGSGVIVDKSGIILTNLHLVEGLDLITVVLSDGRRHRGILIGSDQETDLAVIRIDAKNLPFLRLDEAEPLKVGDIVLAIGNPFGVGQTVTQGIVSATRRRVAGGTAWQNFIQIDAAINPGNSGGALINPLGQLVGVNTAVFRGDSSAVGIGFSIPADLLAQVVPQIIENGSVARGWLGVEVDDITMFPVLRNSNVQGAIVTNVLSNSPAARGGMRPYDVVAQIGDQPISSATQLLLQVSALPPDAQIQLKVLRSETPTPLTDPTIPLRFNTVDLNVKLGTRPTFNYSR